MTTIEESYFKSFKKFRLEWQPGPEVPPYTLCCTLYNKQHHLLFPYYTLEYSLSTLSKNLVTKSTAILHALTIDCHPLLTYTTTATDQ